MDQNGKADVGPMTAFKKQDRDFLGLLGLVVDRNYSNHSTGLHTMAINLGVSERQLQRKFKTLLNCSPSEYLRNFRLQKSLLLLKQGTPVGDVAMDVGFASQSYFTSCFKARFGITPTKFQRWQQLVSAGK